MGACRKFPGGTSISHKDLMSAMSRVSLILILLNREYVVINALEEWASVVSTCDLHV
jgi:hypothetical protein